MKESKKEGGLITPSDGQLIEVLTQIVREADLNFQTVGGSSRHWVRDSFLPALAKRIKPMDMRPPSIIASEIADQFFPVASFQHADLRRQIIKAIEDEREIIKHYINQIGRLGDKR